MSRTAKQGIAARERKAAEGRLRRGRLEVNALLKRRVSLLGFPAPATHPFQLFTLSGFAGVLELFGGILLLIGLFTRPVAFILSGEMAFAYFIAHAPQNFWPLINRGELAVLYCFVFLYFAVAGGGVWSLDNALRNGRGQIASPSRETGMRVRGTS